MTTLVELSSQRMLLLHVARNLNVAQKKIVHGVCVKADIYFIKASTRNNPRPLSQHCEMPTDFQARIWCLPRYRCTKSLLAFVICTQWFGVHCATVAWCYYCENIRFNEITSNYFTSNETIPYRPTCIRSKFYNHDWILFEISIYIVSPDFRNHRVVYFHFYV